jgi:hypothetical protein
MFTWERITSDHGTVDQMLADGEVTPEAASASDLLWAAEWLATYGADNDPEIAQGIANAIGFLIKQAESKEARKALNAAKRAYAAEHGIPIRSVRVAR